MKETIHQFAMPARPPQGGRYLVGPACLAFLLVLLAAVLGLLARTASDAAVAEPTVEGGRAAGDDQPGDPVASASGSLQEILAHPDLIPTHQHPLLGRHAPDFELADPEGKVWSLRELLDGRSLVLIFSYGFHCIHCVRQLSDVKRDLPLFGEVGARVVAISADPPEATRRHFQQHGPFGFPVLSDPGSKVAQAYRVFRPAPDGQADLRHGTFVIHRGGTVQWVNVGDAPLRRNPALLCAVARMEGRLPPAQAGP